MKKREKTFYILLICLLLAGCEFSKNGEGYTGGGQPTSGGPTDDIPEGRLVNSDSGYTCQDKITGSIVNSYSKIIFTSKLNGSHSLSLYSDGCKMKFVKDIELSEISNIVYENGRIIEFYYKDELFQELE